MRHYLEKARDMVLAVRPYSIIAATLVAFVAHVIGKQSMAFDLGLALDVIFAVLWWSTLLLFVEYRKNGQLDPKIVLACFLTLVVIVLVRSPLSILLVALAVAMVYWYMSKNKNRLCALSSQAPRAMIEVTLFLVVLSFNTPIIFSVISDNALFLLTLFFIIAVRNFEGDIRDMTVDRYSIAKELGKKNARRFSAILLALICALVFNETAFPLAILLGITLAFRDVPNLHQVHVITTTFFLAETAIHVMGGSLIIFHLLYLSTVLNFTYDHVPRTKNLLKRNLQHPRGKIKDESLVEALEKRIIDKMQA